MREIFSPTLSEPNFVTMENTDTRSLLKEAEELFKARKWELAARKYGDVVGSGLFVDEVIGNMAICSMKMGDFEMAEEGALMAGGLNAGSPIYDEIRAQALIKQDKYREALQACNDGLTIDPTILSATDADMAALKRLKEYCEEKLKTCSENANLEIARTQVQAGNLKKHAESIEFRQFDEGFISHEIWENLEELKDKED